MIIFLLILTATGNQMLQTPTTLARTETHGSNKFELPDIKRDIGEYWSYNGNNTKECKLLGSSREILLNILQKNLLTIL